jgi:hypothetical protein
LAFAADGESLAFPSVTSTDRVTQIDPRSGRERGDTVDVSHFINELQYLPDGETLLIADARGAVWPVDMATANSGAPAGWTRLGARWT